MNDTDFEQANLLTLARQRKAEDRRIKREAYQRVVKQLLAATWEERKLWTTRQRETWLHETAKIIRRNNRVFCRKYPEKCT